MISKLMLASIVQRPMEWPLVVEMKMASEVWVAWSLQSEASLSDAVKAGAVPGRVHKGICSWNAFGTSGPEGLPM